MKLASLGLAAVLGCLVVAFSLAATPPRVQPPEPSTGTSSRLESSIADVANLDAFLETVPSLKSHLVWNTGAGKAVHYEQWTAEQKARFKKFYDAMLAGAKDLDMQLASEKNIDPSCNVAYFTEAQAFDLYAAHAAHALYVEAKRRVPWSIAELPGAQLDVLLNSERYVARIGPSTGNTYPTGIQPGRDFVEAPENNALAEFNGDPRSGYDFVDGETAESHKTMIAKTPEETLVNLTAWMRDNLDHGPIDGKVNEREKTNRWFIDRLRAFPGTHKAMAVQGCHSAAKLLVDLARSVNIPLLNVRSIDPAGDSASNFFNRTHGAAIFGVGGKSPLVLWHIDDIYATEGRICFPLDSKTGKLASAEVANKMYFDAHWISPKELEAVGFDYKLEMVYPNKGYGHDSRGAYEDRVDYGWMIGLWKIKDKSDLSQYHQLQNDYQLGGQPLLDLYVNNVVEAQLTSNIAQWRGGWANTDPPAVIPIADYNNRAKACIDALGGTAKYQAAVKTKDAEQGKDLMIPNKPETISKESK